MQGVQLDALSINFDQQSTLARLLAKENITVIHGTYKTAWFDPERRVLALPIWKNKGKAVYDLLTGHEVGHALYTPAKGWHDAVDDIDGAPKAYLNILEDVRIERKVQDRYPGLRFQFQKAYKQLAEDDFFGLNKGLVDLNMIKVIDKINIKAKLGQNIDVVFDDEERDFFHRAFNTETFEDVVALAKEIYEYQKSLQADMPMEDVPISVSSRGEDDFGDDQEFEESDADYEKPEKSAEEPQAEQSEASEEKPEDGLTGTGRRDDEIKKQLTDKDAKTAPQPKQKSEAEAELEEALTDKAFREKEKELVADNMGGTCVFTINKCKQKDVVIDYKKYYSTWNEYLVKYNTTYDEWHVKYMQEKLATAAEKFKKFKQDTEVAAAYMAKEFEMRKAAYQYSRSSLQKTGIINTNKLHAYKFSEDIFMKSTKLANYKNHGMMLFIDFSGSMSDNMGATIRQTINLAAFCRMINVPFEVYAFTTRVRTEEAEQTKYWDLYNDSEVVLQPFNLLNLLSSRMTRKEFNDGMQMLYNLSLTWDSEVPGAYIGPWNELHSTPLNTCIVYAHELISEFKVKNSIEKMTAMFLTDGESDSFQVRQTDLGRDHSANNDGYSFRGRKAIVRFRNKGFVVNSMYGSDVTTKLLKSLKQDTGSNVLGFFISEYRNQAVARAAEAHDWSKRTELKNKYTNQMNKNRCLIEDDIFGYDRYFGLCTKYMDLAEDDFGELVEDGASKTKIKTAFAKATKSRRVNRILLNAFVDAIA